MVDKKPIRVFWGSPSKALTAGIVEKRLAFAHTHSKSSFAEVLVTDRVRLAYTFPGTRVKRCHWIYKGQRVYAFKPNHPSGVNLYAGISRFGKTRLYLVSGTTGLRTPYVNKAGQPARNITTAEYSDVLLKGMLPDGDMIFRQQGITTWKLQQDNDPCHRAGSMQALEQFNQQGRHHVTLLQDWPPNSPDLSPIENLWGILQDRVNSRGCTTFQQFKAAVFEEWDKVDLPLLQSLMGSMNSRGQLCVKANGGKIRY